MKPRLYLETTIPSYLAARPSKNLITAANQQLTRDWWEYRRKDFKLYVSQFVLAEAAEGDKSAARDRMKMLADLTVLEASDELEPFATEIVTSGILPPKASVDALHIAIATLNRMDYLVTWNCVHIANATIQKDIRELCRNHGLECPVICTPAELMVR